MKPFFRLLFLFSIINLIFACNATKPLSSAMRVAKNDAFKYTITQRMGMQVSVMGQNMETTGKQETDYSFKITEVLGNGNFETDVTIDRVALNQKIPMAEDIKYDSADPRSNQNPSLKPLGEIVGKKIMVTYDKNGKVIKTEGIEKILGEVTENMEGQVAQQIVQQLGSAGFHNSFRLLSGFIQGTPSVGNSWTVKNEFNGLIDMEWNQTFTLTERKNGQAILTITGTAETIDSDSGLEFQGMQISQDLSGPITGTIIVDEATGWAISSEITPNLTGKMTLKGGPFGDISADAAMKLDIEAIRK